MHLVNPEERARVRALIDQPAGAATGTETREEDISSATA